MDDIAFVNELAQVPPLRARFVAELEGAGVDGDELQGWALIFTELVNNAIAHGISNPGDEVTVRWWQAERRVAVSVVDPSDSGLTKQHFDDADCDAFSETGRGAGLFLIRAWVHDLDVLRPPSGGTEIRIERRREGPDQQGTER